MKISSQYKSPQIFPSSPSFSWNFGKSPKGKLAGINPTGGEYDTTSQIKDDQLVIWGIQLDHRHEVYDLF